MSLDLILKKVKTVVVDNSPLILTYLSVAGVVSTTALAVKATPQALDKIAQMRSELDAPTKKEFAQLLWKDYTPALLSGAFTIACIIGAHNINNRRNAALVTVYSLAETALKEYQTKLKEQLGDTKAKQFKDDIAKDHLLDTPMATSQVFITGLGEQLCYDSYTGRYFKSDIETIRRAQNDINAKIFREMYASHNDFYTLIGLERTSFGEEVGWTSTDQLDIEFSSHLASDGRPCLCIEYRTEPVRGYYKFG